VLNDAPATADDAPPHYDSSAIRGVLVIRERLAPLTREEISEQRGRKFHHLRNAKMVTSNSKARELVAQYEGLIWKIVSEPKFTVRRQALIDRDDMFAIGCAMMVQSVEMYEDGRGAKLSTWIAMRVRQGLMCVVNELHSSIRENGGRTGGSRSARGEMLASARGEAPAPEVYVESLSTTIGDELTVLDTLESEEDRPDDRLEAGEEREWLVRAIEQLCDPRERDILYRTLAGEGGQEIATRYGVARQRIDQIYQGAVAKLAARRRREDMKRATFHSA